MLRENSRIIIISIRRRVSQHKIMENRDLQMSTILCVVNAFAKVEIKVDNPIEIYIIIYVFYERTQRNIENRGLVKWYDRGLQNLWWEFDSLIPCY